MNLLKGRVLLTVFITLFSFLSVGYVACSKEEPPSSNDPCSKMFCKNGGNCFKGKCTCPAGFDGDSCETAWITPYLGTWDIKEVISASTMKANIGTERKYAWTITKHSSANKFVIDQIMARQDFSNIEATIGGATGRLRLDFTIDPRGFAADSMKTQIKDGKGNINSVGTTIAGVYTVSYIRNNQAVTETMHFEGTYRQ